MNSNDFKILKFIFDNREQVKIQLIALKNNISTDYAYLVCRSLERMGHINLIRSNLCQLTSKGIDFFKKDSGKAEIVTRREDDSDGELGFNLIKAGYKTAADLASVPLARLTQNFNISVKKAAGLINEARERLKDNENVPK